MPSFYKSRLRLSNAIFKNSLVKIQSAQSHHKLGEILRVQVIFRKESMYIKFYLTQSFKDFDFSVLPNLPIKGASFISTFFSTEVASPLSVNEITTKWFSLVFVSSTDQGGNSWTKLVIMRLITGLLDCRDTKNIHFAHHS